MISDISISNVQCEGAEHAIRLIGLEPQSLKDISFNNLKIKAEEGFLIENTGEIQIDNITIDK